MTMQQISREGRFGIDRLETRELLAGNVTSVFSSGVLPLESGASLLGSSASAASMDGEIGRAHV